MSDAELNTRFRAVLRQDRVLELLERLNITLPESVTGVSTREQQEARDVRTRFGLPRGLTMPSNDELRAAVEGMQDQLSRSLRGAPPGVMTSASAHELQGTFGRLLSALSSGNSSLVWSALQNAGNLSTRVSEFVQNVPRQTAQLLRNRLGMGGDTPLTTAEAQARVRQLVGSVNAIGPTVRMGNNTIEMDTAMDLPGPNGTTIRETPREHLVRRLTALQTSLQASGANVAQILGQEGTAEIMRDVAGALGGNLPPPESGPAAGQDALRLQPN